MKSFWTFLFALITLIINATSETNWTLPPDAHQIDLSNVNETNHLIYLLNPVVGFSPGCILCEIRTHCLQNENSTLKEITAAYKFGRNYQLNLTMNYNEATALPLEIKFRHHDGTRLTAIRKFGTAGPIISPTCFSDWKKKLREQVEALEVQSELEGED